MPERGDDRTELQPESGATPPPSSPPDERTEQAPDAPSQPAPDPPATPAADPTELAPPQTPAQPSGPRTVRPGEDLTEPQSAAETHAGQVTTGRHVPGYKLVEPLGSGTYGEVWLAEEERTGIRVAIKFLAHGTGLEWQLVQAEVKQLALLHADPGIVQLLDVELDARPPYYVMAYAERGSLARRLEQGPLPLAEALEIFRQLAEALAYVHAKGVRHCDLKPGNVLLNARNRALIADFGQAHLSTEACPALGTFFYMAPEQADLARQIPDTRWDVYGLGAILYAMLTGRPPREAPTVRADLGATSDLDQRLGCYRRWVEKAPRPDEHRRLAGMDRWLVEILDRCLEVDPQRRLHDAGAVLEALARRERQRRQRPLLVFGFVAQVLIFLLMGGIAAWAATAAVARSESALIEQLLESDRVAAALVANGVQEQLRARLGLLEHFALDPALREAVVAGNADAVEKRLRTFNAGPTLNVRSWAVADPDGYVMALVLDGRRPPDFDPSVSFAWRDWFNGRGDHFERKGKVKKGEFEPIQDTHISQPFIRKFSKDFSVGLSTPLFDPKKPKRIIGVLYTPVPLREIQSWLDPVKIRGGFAVLVDRHGYCLRHPNEARIRPRPDENPTRWFAPDFVEKALTKEGSTDRHTDPIDGKEYLAGYHPLKEIGWGAIVQHERATALKPIDDLRAQLMRVGATLVLSILLLLSALWGWLIWNLRRKDRVAQG
ncbi:MAG: protein kinase [Gemmataceae bacterium]|nr:protein kinase [Gemmataceae bacterium]